jgi:hypothetical protein
VIARDIEHSKIFKDITEKRNFMECLGGIFNDTETRCYGWALLSEVFQKTEEGLPGDNDFVEFVHQRLRKNGAKICPSGKGCGPCQVSKRMGERFDLTPLEFWLPGKHHQRVRVKSFFCYWASGSWDPYGEAFPPDGFVGDNDELC